MSTRKCIYTGKDAKRTDKVIPKKDGDEVHNWANSAPCSDKYKNIKGTRLPTELELKANKAFKQLELAKLDVQFYETELNRLQSEIVKTLPKEPKPSVNTKKKKDKEIKIAYKEKEIKEIDFDKVLNKKKLEW